MKVLLVTSSARGHAIADALSRSSHKPEIIAVSPQRNPGIRALATQQYEADILDFNAVTEVARKHKCNWAFIGPDDPIGMGLADSLEEVGIPSVAPKKALARIEASKGFTRDLLAEYSIDASPKYKAFTRAEPELIHQYLEEDLAGEYVVKYDALKGGKGVKVSGDHLDTIAHGVEYAMECIEECGQVVIEEKLIGVEFSLISFVSGSQIVDMPCVQDHKRAYIGDTGPNTGGMGTYSDANHSLPFLSEADVARASEIGRLTIEALSKKCGEPYKGILFGGFIVTKNGVKLIEYNARFGDPEALNILPLLSSDFVEICQGVINGELTSDLVKFDNKATVCKYITPESYPSSKDQKGEPVVFPEMPDNARLYYGDISESDDGQLLLGGSRTAGVVGIGDSIEEAEQVAQKLCEQVTGPVRFREDIGTQELVQKRIEMVEQL